MEKKWKRQDMLGAEGLGIRKHRRNVLHLHNFF